MKRVRGYTHIYIWGYATRVAKLLGKGKNRVCPSKQLSSSLFAAIRDMMGYKLFTV